MCGAMTAPRHLALALLCVLTACGDDESPQPPMSDSSTPMLDGSIMDSGTDDAATMLDTGIPAEDAATDAGIDSGLDSAIEEDGGQDAAADASTPGVTHAVLGTRCALSERVGLIEVTDQGGASPYVSGAIYDRPDPQIGAPEIEGEDCDFHQAPSGLPCNACSGGKVCSAQETCADPQQPILDPVLKVTKAGAASQTIETDETSGSIYGEAELAAPFGLELTFGAQTVLVAETSLPSGLTNPAGTLSGSYDAPEAIDISWSGATEGSVFTHVPNNHHVGGQTFTECAVDASSSELHIDGELLVPLSGVTGLEFQGIKHVVFAAAETAAGCVEIRYSVDQFVSL